MSKNKFVCVGVLSEITFNAGGYDSYMWLDGEKTNKMMHINTIRGRMSIDCGAEGIKDFKLEAQDYRLFQKTGVKAEVSKSYDNLTKLMAAVGEGKIVPASEGGHEVVRVSGEVTNNVYFSEKKNETVETTDFTVAFVTTGQRDEPETFGCSATVTCFIKAKSPEENDGEETGRLNVTCIASPAFGRKLFPLTSNSRDKYVHVSAELAEDFDDMLEECGPGCYDLNFDLVSKNVVKVQPKTTGRSFGHAGKVSTAGSSYSIPELMIVGGTFVEPVIEEDDDGNEVIKNPYDVITAQQAKEGMEAYQQEVACAESKYYERQNKKKAMPISDGDLPF